MSPIATRVRVEQLVEKLYLETAVDASCGNACGDCDEKGMRPKVCECVHGGDGHSHGFELCSCDCHTYKRMDVEDRDEWVLRFLEVLGGAA